FTGFGFFEASAEVSPPKADQIVDAILAIAGDLEKNGVTEDELARAKQPALTAIRESLRENGYWLGALTVAQERPEYLDRVRTRVPMFESMSVADLNALAKQYLAPERAFRVI